MLPYRGFIYHGGDAGDALGIRESRDGRRGARCTPLIVLSLHCTCILLEFHPQSTIAQSAGTSQPALRLIKRRLMELQNSITKYEAVENIESGGTARTSSPVKLRFEVTIACQIIIFQQELHNLSINVLILYMIYDFLIQAWRI